MIHYTASVPRFEGFDHARLFNACWIMTSFGETRMAAVSRFPPSLSRKVDCWILMGANSWPLPFQISADPMQAGELVRMTKAQNTRTFPAGTRVNSSNFDPQQMWLAGTEFYGRRRQKKKKKKHLHSLFTFLTWPFGLFFLGNQAVKWWP